MKLFFKKTLLSVFLLGIMIFFNSNIVFAEDIDKNHIEDTVTEYFNNEWNCIKNNNTIDSSELVLDNDFKNYYDNYIDTRVQWYNSINKALQNYELYINVENIQYYNNEYVVNVTVGHDLIFSDCNDIVQKMRGENHIIILAYENNSLKIKCDFKEDELTELGYSIKNIDASTLDVLQDKIIKIKTEFIVNCKENIKKEVLNYKILNTNTLKSNLLTSTRASSFNRQAAVNYAAANYQSNANNDCTNFISNCLYAGGLYTTSLWKPGSAAWINVQLFYDYMVTASNRASQVTWSTSIGDIVQFGTNSINWHHSTIITYVRPTTGEVFLSAHSNSRYNYAYANYFGDYSTSRFIHIY